MEFSNIKTEIEIIKFMKIIYLTEYTSLHEMIMNYLISYLVNISIEVFERTRDINTFTRIKYLKDYGSYFNYIIR